MFKAWRVFNDGRPGYVETIGGRGDRYSYTTNAEKALTLTDAQRKAFLKYMSDCGTVGFYLAV